MIRLRALLNAPDAFGSLIPLHKIWSHDGIICTGQSNSSRRSYIQLYAAADCVLAALDNDEEDRMDHKVIETGVTRRTFGRSALTAGIVAAAGAFLTERTAEAQGLTDADILNFALNLEYLEAEFYTVAVTGKRIAELGIGTNGTGREGATVGGGIVALDARTSTVAMHVAADEQAHVKVLRAALGSAAVAKPAINLEALGIGFRTQNEFITLARAFEDVGVSAYGGAAPLISSREILGATAQIALTEGQHAGVFRLLLRDAAISVPQNDNVDVPPLGSPNGRLFQVDGQGLSTKRTPSQVLAIVYANANAGSGSGGFFPAGVNGTITRV